MRLTVEFLNVLSQTSVAEKNKFMYFLMEINRKFPNCTTSSIRKPSMKQIDFLI